MLRHILVTPCVVLSLAACGSGIKDAEATARGTSTPSDSPILIASEDLVVLHNNSLGSGPIITGSVQPERRADLRAEVSSVVLQVLKENGESVKKGDVLVRLDDTSIRDSLASSEESARVAEQTLDQTERQLQRFKRLRASGLASMQELEDAESHRNNAQSDLAAARTRAVQARQQSQRTLVRAPFDGIVSDRKVSAGDTAQIGKELVKVIDPASIRFEGLVSADKINSVRVGQRVSFKVNGQDQQEFIGKVKRVDPAASPTTRQVAVLVDFTDSRKPRVSGLYAEGIIETDSMDALMIPEAALVRSGDKAYAWRLKDGILKKVAIVIGARDSRHGDYVVRSGLANGDKLIHNPSDILKDGQRVEMSAAANQSTSQAPVAQVSLSPSASAATRAEK